MICSLEVRLFLVDSKIVELKFTNDVPHLLTPVITDPKRAFQALQYCISEMERRYTLLDALGVRDIPSRIAFMVANKFDSPHHHRLRGSSGPRRPGGPSCCRGRRPSRLRVPQGSRRVADHP